MKISTKIVLKAPDGKNYKDIDDIVIKTKEDAENAPDLTLGKVVGKSLAIQKSTDPWKSYKLTNDFLKDTVDLKSEDIVFIKEIMKEAEWLPYIIGQVFEILEGNAENKK